MEIKRFIHNDITRKYHVFGQGDEVLYCFHGFGQSPLVWKIFQEWLVKRFLVFAFTDFFHEEERNLGNSQITSLKKSNLQLFFKAFSESKGHGSINLMAYSSGGRNALTLIEGAELNIKETWLFAPDGIEQSFWNGLFCSYSFVQRLFKKVIDKPDGLFSIVGILAKLRLIDSSLATFVLFSMRNKSQREKIYRYWMLYKDILPNQKRLIEVIDKGSLNVHLVFGKKDVVIPPEIGRRFMQKCKRGVDLLELDGGHRLIDDRFLKTLEDWYCKS